MNILSATAPEQAKNQIYNVALGDRTTLNSLYLYIKQGLEGLGHKYEGQMLYQDFRAGDVRHSQANIEKAINKLGYSPTYEVKKV